MAIYNNSPTIARSEADTIEGRLDLQRDFVRLAEMLLPKIDPHYRGDVARWIIDVAMGGDAPPPFDHPVLSIAKPEFEAIGARYRAIQTDEQWAITRAEVATQVSSSMTRYANAVTQAEKRGLEFKLSYETYTRLVQQRCTYCDFPISNKGVGLDRIDHSLGYLDLNVAPCCGLCNLTRGDRFSFDEMKLLGATIRGIRDARGEVGV